MIGFMIALYLVVKVYAMCLQAKKPNSIDVFFNSGMNNVTITNVIHITVIHPHLLTFLNKLCPFIL